MGYACPVCEAPQADGEHLANHLAFTAMLGDDDHEAWLDEHAPDWGDCDPETLAERVLDHAETTEFPQVFEDTTGRTHDHNHDHDHDHDHDGSGQTRGPGRTNAGRSRGTGDGDTPAGMSTADLPDGERAPSDVLAEARELTRKRREAGDGSANGENTDGDDEVGVDAGDEVGADAGDEAGADGSD